MTRLDRAGRDGARQDMAGNLYWISGNLYIDGDISNPSYYAVNYRRVGARTLVREMPVRIGKEDILRRGSQGMRGQSALHNEDTA